MEKATLKILPTLLFQGENSQRSDYNLMERTNRHEITDYGWVHIQDNKKIKIKSDNIELLAAERRVSPLTEELILKM